MSKRNKKKKRNIIDIVKNAVSNVIPNKISDNECSKFINIAGVMLLRKLDSNGMFYVTPSNIRIEFFNIDKEKISFEKFELDESNNTFFINSKSFSNRKITKEIFTFLTNNGYSGKKGR